MEINSLELNPTVLVNKLLTCDPNSKFFINFKEKSKDYINDLDNLDIISSFSTILFTLSTDSDRLAYLRNNLSKEQTSEFVSKIVKKKIQGQELTKYKVNKVYAKTILNKNVNKSHAAIVNCVFESYLIFIDKFNQKIVDAIPTELFKGIMEDVDNQITDINSFSNFKSTIYSYSVAKFHEYLSQKDVPNSLATLFAIDEFEKKEILEDIKLFLEKKPFILNKPEKTYEVTSTELKKALNFTNIDDYDDEEISLLLDSDVEQLNEEEIDICEDNYTYELKNKYIQKLFTNFCNSINRVVCSRTLFNILNK